MKKFVNPAVPLAIKEEVYDYILSLYKKDKKITVDFRAFKNAIDARTGNPQGWQGMVKVIVNYRGK